VPLETYERMLQAIGTGAGGGFDMLDLEPARLPAQTW
jgi:hypothetical protein